MTRRDFITHMDLIWSNNLHYGFNELLDTRNADWDQFGFSDIFEIVRKEYELLSISSRSKFAWVVKKGMQEDLASFYITALGITCSKPRKIQIFYSYKKAVDWLQSEL